MRKIKSVKTKELYKNGFETVAIGKEGWKEADLWHFTSNFSTVHYSEEWILAHKGLFTIEYEPEGFEFSTYGTRGFGGVYDFDKLVNSELNRLADWCDGQSEKSISHYMVYYDASTESFYINFYSMDMIHQGLKFCSEKSAELFITELNKPENSDYKNYFIELLKKTRL